MTDLDSLARVATELTGEVVSIHEAMDKLVVKSNRLDQTTKRLRRVIWWTVISVFLDITLSVVLAFALFSQSATTDQLRNAQNQIQAQQAQTAKTRHKVLCPLYQVLLAASDPAVAAKIPPDRRDMFDRAFVVIKQGYDSLDCSKP